MEEFQLGGQTWYAYGRDHSFIENVEEFTQKKIEFERTLREKPFHRDFRSPQGQGQQPRLPQGLLQGLPQQQENKVTEEVQERKNHWNVVKRKN